ncbi:MAG: DUF5343 domain-containing protein [Bryobacteraceae bacterium]
MSLPDSYTLKPGAVPAYFDTILAANPPERFSVKFLENLGFTGTNDRLLVGILKDLGFIDPDGAPQKRYFEFMDPSQSKLVLAEAIRRAYADLFAINKKANELSAKEVSNKLRTLYAGKKTDLVIGNIAKTFYALCQYADFSGQRTELPKTEEKSAVGEKEPETGGDGVVEDLAPKKTVSLSIDSMQYHINIVLPESRDQAVYDAIFKSLKDHLR